MTPCSERLWPAEVALRNHNHGTGYAPHVIHFIPFSGHALPMAAIPFPLHASLDTPRRPPSFPKPFSPIGVRPLLKERLVVLQQIVPLQFARDARQELAARMTRVARHALRHPLFRLLVRDVDHAQRRHVAEGSGSQTQQIVALSHVELKECARRQVRTCSSLSLTASERQSKTRT